MREAPAARSPATGAEGEGLLAASATGKVPPCHRADSAGRSLGNIPLRSVESIGARCGESICLSLGMGSIQSFVSLDKVRYTVAYHENIGTKWLPRPPPLSGGGQRDWGSAVPWGGLETASLGGRPAPCAGRTGTRGYGAPQPSRGRWKAASQCPLPGTHIPKRPGPLEHPRAGRRGRAGRGAGRCGTRRCIGSAEGSCGRGCCLPAASPPARPGPAAKPSSASRRGRPAAGGRAGSAPRGAGQRAAGRAPGGSPRAPFESGGAWAKFRGREAGSCAGARWPLPGRRGARSRPGPPGGVAAGRGSRRGPGRARGTGGAERHVPAPAEEPRPRQRRRRGAKRSRTAVSRRPSAARGGRRRHSPAAERPSGPWQPRVGAARGLSAAALPGAFAAPRQRPGM